MQGSLILSKVLGRQYCFLTCGHYHALLEVVVIGASCHILEVG